jgi:ABC-type uncharacterized transport system ATPase subunit
MSARMCEAGEITVLMITHKFREVEAYADAVSVLRRGKLVGSGKVAEMSREEMARMMMGDAKLPNPRRAPAPGRGESRRLGVRERTARA